MKAAEFRELPDIDLETEITKAHAKLFKFRFHSANEEMQRAGEIRQARRDIARMKTILRERQLKKETSGREAGNGGA
jgi:large subunit ribosomal protein L29